MKKTFLLRLLRNGIIAVCETLEEAVLAQNNGASAVMLVDHRGKGDTYKSISAENISAISMQLKVPVMVRVRYGHLPEAQLAQGAGADILVEQYKGENSLADAIDPGSIELPIIKEVLNADEIKGNGLNYLLLGDYGTGNVSILMQKLEKIDEDNKVFVGGGISSPPDLKLLSQTNKAYGYFVGTAPFYYDTVKFFRQAIECIA